MAVYFAPTGVPFASTEINAPGNGEHGDWLVNPPE
jgi:hypothetical protein